MIYLIQLQFFQHQPNTYKQHFQYTCKIMRNIIFFLVLSICLGAIHSQGLSFIDLQRILGDTNESPFVNLLLIYDSASQTGPHLQLAMKGIQQKKTGYYKIKMLDCNTEDENVLKNFPYCGDQIRPKLPALIFTEPVLNAVNPQTGNKGQAKQHQYSGQLQQKSLYDFAVPLMRAFSVNLKKTRDWKLFKQKYPQTPKILYFTDKQKLPPIYKALTTNFRSTIAFGHVYKNNPLCAQLNITKFPTLLLNGQTQITLSKDLTQMIQRLKVHEGEQQVIYISELQQKKEELNKQNLQKLVYQTPRHILIHVNNPDGRVHPEWKKSQESFKKMFDYYETEQLAGQLGVKQTPAIVYFPKSLAKKKVQRTVFYPKDTFRQIYDQISSMVEDFSVPLINDMQMQRLTSIPLQQDKLVAVLFHSDEISLSYRYLSNQQTYKQNLVFFRMRDPDEQVMEKFKLTKLPALFVMMNDKSEEAEEQLKKNQDDIPEGRKQIRLKIAQYTGKYNYDDLSTYLGMFIQTKKEVHSQSAEGGESSFSGRVIDVDSQKVFKKNCQDEESCYLLLVDGSQQNAQNNQKYKNQVGKFVNRIRKPFGVVDAACHSQILSALDIQQQQLPTFIHINSKFQKYSRIIGRIEQKAISSMISKIRGNKANYRGFQQLAFAKKNCQKEHEKLKSYKTGQAALTQEQAQILRQIQQEEQLKKLQAQQSGEGKQQKKPKKRRRKPKQEQSSQEL